MNHLTTPLLSVWSCLVKNKFMFKLLTEEGREKVKHEYATRRAVVLLSALTLVLVAAIIGLLPSYLASNARQKAVLERTRIISSAGKRGDELELQAWLRETNRKLLLLSPGLDTERPSDFIKKILDQKIPGIRVTGFSWLKTKNLITLSINGVALDRQTLVAFESRINSSGYFSEVTLPISNLARDRNIDFQIKFLSAASSSPARTP